MKIIVFLLSSLLLFIYLFIDPTNATIDPVLNAQRLALIPRFLRKSTESIEYARGNLTQDATTDFCLLNQYAGDFCADGTLSNAAEDYAIIPLVQIPVNGQYYQVTYINFVILDIYLYEEGLTQDTYVVKFVLNNKQFSTQLVDYIVQNGLFYTTYMTFKKGSNKINNEIVQSKDGELFNNANAANPDLATLCGLNLYLSCPIGSTFQNYTDMTDCITKMSVIDYQNTINPCPVPLRSNTTACRIMHNVAAITNGVVSQTHHCPHASTPSTACIDKCRGVCDQCNANAHCEFSVSITGQSSYSCVCNQGYVGNGQQCTPVQCTQQYQCATHNDYNYQQCDTTVNRCKCRDTFTWNSVNGACECLTNSTVQWINGVAKCLPLGRCYEKYQCTSVGQNSAGVNQIAIGDWNQVSCVAYGPLTTLFPLKSCVPNYGYNGGFFTKITCPSPKRQLWNSVTQGNVCLYSDECTADSQCGGNQRVCNFTNGPSQGVGICT